MKFEYYPTNKNTSVDIKLALKIAYMYQRNFTEDQIQTFTGATEYRVQIVCAEVRKQKKEFDRRIMMSKVCNLYDRGLTRQKIAEELGMHFETVAKYMRQRNETMKAATKRKHRTLSRWRIQRRLGPISAGCYVS